MPYLAQIESHGMRAGIGFIPHSENNLSGVIIKCIIEHLSAPDRCSAAPHIGTLEMR
jgi:hypothetical protein